MVSNDIIFNSNKDIIVYIKPKQAKGHWGGNYRILFQITKDLHRKTIFISLLYQLPNFN